MGEASSTSTLRTLMPSGGVCGVLSIMPRIWRAAASAAAGRSAMARASAGVSATSPPGTGTPNSRRIALAWYSCTFTSRAPRGDGPDHLPSAGASKWPPHSPNRGHSVSSSHSELAQGPDDGVVVLGHDALLERNDGVVGDVDVLGADLGAAFRDVAEPETRLEPGEVLAVVGVQRVHVQLRQPHEEARAGEGRLVLLVVADDVADVLAQEALDALAELLADRK